MISVFLSQFLLFGSLFLIPILSALLPVVMLISNAKNKAKNKRNATTIYAVYSLLIIIILFVLGNMYTSTMINPSIKTGLNICFALGVLQLIVALYVPFSKKLRGSMKFALPLSLINLGLTFTVFLVIETSQSNSMALILVVVGAVPFTAIVFLLMMLGAFLDKKSREKGLIQRSVIVKENFSVDYSYKYEIYRTENGLYDIWLMWRDNEQNEYYDMPSGRHLTDTIEAAENIGEHFLNKHTT